VKAKRIAMASSTGLAVGLGALWWTPKAKPPLGIYLWSEGAQENVPVGAMDGATVEVPPDFQVLIYPV
jgi:hypothetical protein